MPLFNNILLLIADYPTSQRILATYLHHMIVDLAPQMEVKITYNIPFYYCYGRLCYINPHKKTDGIDLGFCRGIELSNEQKLLEIKDRKVVCTIDFYTIKELKEKEKFVQEILQEAILLNEWHYHKK